MITVIKNGKAQQVCCPHCESLLEYEIDDLIIGGASWHSYYYYLPCPVCGKEIIGNYFKALIINRYLSRNSPFVELNECAD